MIWVIIAEIFHKDNISNDNNDEIWFSRMVNSVKLHWSVLCSLEILFSYVERASERIEWTWIFGHWKRPAHTASICWSPAGRSAAAGFLPNLRLRFSCSWRGRCWPSEPARYIIRHSIGHSVSMLKISHAPTQTPPPPRPNFNRKWGVRLQQQQARIIVCLRKFKCPKIGPQIGHRRPDRRRSIFITILAGPNWTPAAAAMAAAAAAGSNVQLVVTKSEAAAREWICNCLPHTNFRLHILRWPPGKFARLGLTL